MYIGISFSYLLKSLRPWGGRKWGGYNMFLNVTTPPPSTQEFSKYSLADCKFDNVNSMLKLSWKNTGPIKYDTVNFV